MHCSGAPLSEQQQQQQQHVGLVEETYSEAPPWGEEAPTRCSPAAPGRRMWGFRLAHRGLQGPKHWEGAIWGPTAHLCTLRFPPLCKLKPLADGAWHCSTGEQAPVVSPPALSSRTALRARAVWVSVSGVPGVHSPDVHPLRSTYAPLSPDPSEVRYNYCQEISGLKRDPVCLMPPT